MRPDENQEPDLHAVAIVGAGPVGLSLALGLARQGVRSILVEKKASTSERSKAPAIHLRTLEIFHQWGIEPRFLDVGTLRRRIDIRSGPAREARPFLSIDFSALDREAENAGLMILEQGRTERLLLDAVRETGFCDVRFSCEAVSFDTNGDRVRLRVREGSEERWIEARYLVGCDGAGSFVRNALGLPFEGRTYRMQPMLADIRVEDERDALDWPRIHNDGCGLSLALRLSPKLWRIIRLDRGTAEKGQQVPADEVRERMAELLGEGPAEIVWANRFRMHLRSSARFRVGRVLLAGDAAHIHSPAGGQGMNAGIQDAHNLAWKLAAALKGGDEDRLLDSYDVERRAVVVGDVSRFTDLITRLFVNAPAFLRTAILGVLRMGLALPALRRMILHRITMIDLDYPASPLLSKQERGAGCRLPNPQLRSPDGRTVRLHDLLPDGPALITVSRDGSASNGLPLAIAVGIGPGGYDDPSGLLKGLLPDGGWVLVRPDRYIAWARDRPEGLEAAIELALGCKS